jgi:GH24 family phage-related lysozyme (muramidase)
MQDLEQCERLTRYFFRRQERPDEVLRTQLLGAKYVVQSLITAPLTDHQRQALVCLFADVLAGLVHSPTVDLPRWQIVAVLNRRMYQVAAGQFLSFCNREGKVDQRALRKRMCEQQLFSTGKLQFSD